MTELLACPFCGNEKARRLMDSEELNLLTGNYTVVCCIFNEGCGASGGYKQSDHEAVEIWNVRPEKETESLTPEQFHAEYAGAYTWEIRKDNQVFCRCTGHAEFCIQAEIICKALNAPEVNSETKRKKT